LIFRRPGRPGLQGYTDHKNALFWLTIEGGEGKIEAQIWISTFGLPQSRVVELQGEWGSRLKKVLG
jgi:hypothetical protein